MNPIETGNIVLILVGIGLVLSGPIIAYRTTKTLMSLAAERRTNPTISLHKINNGLNYVIAVLCVFAGILFIINNLRGNPLG